MSDDRFGPDLEARLRAELERVQPPHTSPRYLVAPLRRPLTGRLAPALLGASVISILALSAFVASGSPNPAVWGHDVVTIIQSSSTTPSPPASSPKPTIRPKPTPTPEPNEHRSPEPKEQPSAEPSDGHSGEGSGSTDGGGDSHDGGTSDSDDSERS